MDSIQVSYRYQFPIGSNEVYLKQGHRLVAFTSQPCRFELWYPLDNHTFVLSLKGMEGKPETAGHRRDVRRLKAAVFS
jgi:hypothetical protein